MEIFEGIHLSEDALNLHAVGDLPPPLGAVVRAHLAQCRTCRLRLRQACEFITLLRATARRAVRAQAAVGAHTV